MGHNNEEIQDLRKEWLPKELYGEENYSQRLSVLKRKRYYGESQEDKSGILRYTKAVNSLLDKDDIPEPETERELTWLFSYFWNLDQAYPTLTEAASHLDSQPPPPNDTKLFLQEMFDNSIKRGLALPNNAKDLLGPFGISI